MTKPELTRQISAAYARGLPPQRVFHECTPAALSMDPPMSLVDLAGLVTAACPKALTAEAEPGRARRLVEPEILPTLTGRRFTWPAAGIAVTVEKMHPQRETVWGELTIDLDPERHPTAPERLHGPVTMSLMTTPQLVGTAAHMERRLPTGVWGDILETACRMAVAVYRTPEPPVRLADPIAGPPTADYAIDPILVEGDPTLIFAPGGVGKSTLALALAAAMDGAEDVVPWRVRTRHKVAYLDWEWSRDRHMRRLARLLSPAQMAASQMLYRRMTGTLVSQVGQIAAMIAEHAVSYLIIDSIGMACGGATEKSDVAIAMGDAVRSLGVGSLWVGHVAKGGSGETVHGSVMWTNQARSAWQVQPAAEQPPGRTLLALHQRKVNDGPPQEPVSVLLDWRGERLSIVKTDIYGEPQFQDGLTARGRIHNLLRQGSATTLEIAAATGVPHAEVKDTLDRMARGGHATQLSSGAWGLSDRKPAPARRDINLEEADDEIPFEFRHG